MQEPCVFPVSPFFPPPPTPPPPLPATCLVQNAIFYISTVVSWLDNMQFNPLNAKLNLICHLLALLKAHLILHINRTRVNI